MLPLTVILKALDALKHICQSDVIIIDNESFLFIWETYLILQRTSFMDGPLEISANNFILRLCHIC